MKEGEAEQSRRHLQATWFCRWAPGRVEGMMTACSRLQCASQHCKGPVNDPATITMRAGRSQNEYNRKVLVIGGAVHRSVCQRRGGRVRRLGLFQV